MINDYDWNVSSDPNMLIHYGIKGMKWGQRRYQNKDGTYTALGKKRRNSGEQVHEDYTNAHSKRSVKSMSTKELQERNKRLQAEKQYTQLSKRDKSAAEKIVISAATGALTGILVSRMTKGGNSAVDKGEAFIKNVIGDHIAHGTAHYFQAEAHLKEKGIDPESATGKEFYRKFDELVAAQAKKAFN